MATLGVNDLKNVALPSAWDTATLTRLALRDGRTYAQVLGDINDALTIVNAGFGAGYLGSLMAWTSDATVEYRTGVSNGFEDHTEYGRPDAKRAATTGHMLPIKKKDRALGWTTDFLEECRASQLDADIASAVDDAKNEFEKAILTRLFKMEEETGAAYGLGSSGVSSPLADGSAGTVAFTPVAMAGRGLTSPASSHDHFLRLNGITQANLETAVATVWEHGHDAPYDLIASLADIDSWKTVANVTGYVARDMGLVNYGSSTATAQVADVYAAVITTKYGPVRVYYSGRVPTGYWGVTKTYGVNDSRNVLRVRYDEMWGQGVKLYSENVSTYPLNGAILQMKVGVGIGDRTLAVVVENDTSGDYATPTIA